MKVKTESLKVEAKSKSARAFTLTELLVAVAVLAGLMLGFSMILAQSQRVVNGAQGIMRANIKAAAIDEVIRGDMRQISKNGFLYIDSNHLIFTTAGPAPSMTEAVVGNGSLVAYARNSNNNNQVLYRQRWVLSTEQSQEAEEVTDIWGDADFADIQTMPVADLESLAGQAQSKVDGLSVAPPPTSDNVNELWKVLATGCTDFTVDYAMAGQGGTVIWDNQQETWTHENQANWPLAVRIRFDIEDEGIAKIFGDGEGNNTAEYEIICTVGG